jgi:taurine transport system permease protein
VPDATAETSAPLSGRLPPEGAGAAARVRRFLAEQPALRTLGPFVPLVLLWWAIVEAGLFPRTFFPEPVEVVQVFFRLIYKGILPEYLGDSVYRLSVGVAAGIAVGLPLGLLVGLSSKANRFLWPLIVFFQAIGDIAWLPILLLWFGFGLTTVTFVIVYTVVFPIVLNVALGVRSIPEPLLRAARSLGAGSRQILWEVVLPGALPSVIVGLRNGLGYGWRALIAAEMIVGTSGIGFLMFDARRAGQVTEVILGMILLGILWFVVDAWVLVPIERATAERWGLTVRAQ